MDEEAILRKQEAWIESAYIAGLKAGYNFGIVEDIDGLNKAIEARAGYLKPLKKEQNNE